MGKVVMCVAISVLASSAGSAAELVIVGPRTLTPGDEVGFLVAVRDPTGPAAGRSVQVHFGDQPIASSATDRGGRTLIRLTLAPSTPPGAGTLTFAAAGLSQTVAIEVQNQLDLLLTTDKQHYQQGERIRVRCFAVFDRRREPAARQPLRVQVITPHGQTIANDLLTTNAYGVVATSVPLAQQAAVGTYHVRAASSSTRVERQVSVTAHAAAPFDIEVQPTTPVFFAGEPLSMAIEARRRTGGVLANAEVAIVATTLVRLPGRRDQHEANEYVEIHVVLDEEGRAQVEIPPAVPPHGVELGDDAQVSLRVSVADATGQRQERVIDIPWVDQPLILGAHWMHPPIAGMANRLAVIVQEPDGVPAAAEVTARVHGGYPVTGRSNAFGVAMLDIELPRSPEPSFISLFASRGEERTHYQLAVHPSSNGLGLVVDRPVVVAGEPIEVEARWQNGHAAMELYLLMAGSVVDYQVVDLQGTERRALLSPPAGQTGLASIIARRGSSTAQATALVLADAHLDVELQFYGAPARPGDEVELSLEVADDEQRPVIAAIELSILDTGTKTMTGHGSPGREALFASLPQAVIAELQDSPLASSAGSLTRVGFQHAMGFWLERLGWQENRLRITRRETHEPAPRWVVALASILAALPSLSNAYAVEWAWRLSGLVLALLVALWWWWRRPLISLDRIGILALAAGIVLVPLIPWGAGAPRCTPLEKSGDPRLADPRRYVGFTNEGPFSHGAVRDAIAPDMPTVIDIRENSILANGELVVTRASLDSGASEHASGALLSEPLHAWLLAHAKELRSTGKLHPNSESTDKVVILAPPDVPTRTLARIMDSAAKANLESFVLARHDELRAVVPPAKIGPAGVPFLYVLLFVVLAALLILHRVPPSSWVALGVLAVACFVHYLVRAFPLGDPDSYTFPLESAALALTPLAGLALVAVFVWELVLRRPPSIALAIIGFVWVLLGVSLSRDFRAYFRLGVERRLAAPTDEPPFRLQPEPPVGAREPRVQGPSPNVLTYDPLVVTDAAGTTRVALPLANRPTTWTAIALAHDERGALGVGQADIVAAQALHLEVEPPDRLSVDDRFYLPVSIYNQTNEAREVTARLVTSVGLAAVEPIEVIAQLAAHGGAQVFLPFVATRPGEQTIGCLARSGELSEEVNRSLGVLPRQTWNVDKVLTLAIDSKQQAEFVLPAAALADTIRMTVTVYPSAVSHLLDRTDRLLSSPSGCSEAIISATLPSLYILEHLKASRAGPVELAEQARDRALSGFQQLLAHEFEDGGFTSCGSGAPLAWLSAYALELLARLRAQLDIGEPILERTAAFVNTALAASDAGERAVLLASVARSLAHVDLPLLRSSTNAMIYQEIEAALSSSDPYRVALASEALVELRPDHPRAQDLLAHLTALGRHDEHGMIVWETAATPAGGHKRRAHVEVTSRAARALVLAGEQAPAAGAITWLLLNNRPIDRHWPPNHDATRALEALFAYARASGTSEPITTLSLTVNGAPVSLESSAGILHANISSSVISGRNELTLQGDSPGGLCVGELSYRVLGSPKMVKQAAPVRLTVSFEHQELMVHEVLHADIRIVSTGQPTGPLVLNFPVPPGFAPMTQLLESRQQGGDIEHFAVQGGEMVLGFPALKRGGQHTARVSLRAVLPVEVEAAGISVGDYDNPAWKAACPPVRLRVLPSPMTPAPRQEEVEVRALPYEPFPVIDPPRARGWTSPLDAR